MDAQRQPLRAVGVGPFNSWDRQVFGWETDGAALNLIPLYNEIHHNFMIANYGAGMAIDNDDGSSYDHLSYSAPCHTARNTRRGHGENGDSAPCCKRRPINLACNRTVPSLQHAAVVAMRLHAARACCAAVRSR